MTDSVMLRVDPDHGLFIESAGESAVFPIEVLAEFVDAIRVSERHVTIRACNGTVAYEIVSATMSAIRGRLVYSELWGGVT